MCRVTRKRNSCICVWSQGWQTTVQRTGSQPVERFLLRCDRCKPPHTNSPGCRSCWSRLASNFYVSGYLFPQVFCDYMGNLGLTRGVVWALVFWMVVCRHFAAAASVDHEEGVFPVMAGVPASRVSCTYALVGRVSDKVASNRRFYVVHSRSRGQLLLYVQDV